MLIDKEALIEIIKKSPVWTGLDIITRINAMPTIEPKRGEWISRNPYWHTAICSNCNKVTMFEEWDDEVWEYHFCPNCGADMKGADDEQIHRRQRVL